VESVGPRANALAALTDGRVVAVEQGNLLGTSFHPEVTGDTRFHEYFLAKVRAA
jgi:5'-phosphate synthase pdxT subunit